MAEFDVRIARSLEKVMKAIQKDLKKELAMQGHILTGKLRDSITYEIKREQTKVVAEMTALDYGMIIEVGVPASRIPYGGGKGKKSKYIEGLVRFWQIKKNLAPKEALRAAFATARVHKKEGMPSRGSYQYSKNGDRKNWIKNTLERNLLKVGGILEKEVGVTLALEFADVIKFEPIKFSV